MSSLRLAAVLFLALPISTPVFAADAGSAPAVGGFREDYLRALGRVQEQTLALEQAMPQKKFTWRPAKGVRSVAEVYLHVAGGIYFLAGQFGHEVPADVKALEAAKKWESQTTNKDEIKTILTASFDYLRKNVADMSDADLDKQVQFFGQPWSERLLLMAAQGHCWEHLGQSIAYARVNGVVPPWSKPDNKD
jgi:uncharacterized damage-inducible protein DinB